jgi:hypothetical protein
MEDPKTQDDEMQLPEDRVEDLEPEAGEAGDVSGGKYSNIVLKRGADSLRQ